MGSLSRSFVLPRNALKSETQASAASAMRSIEEVRMGIDLAQLKSENNGAYNVYRDFISFTGIIERRAQSAVVTPVGEAFARLYRQNPTDAWRWLLTRALWLYTVPNGTDAAVNQVAAAQDISFDFFRRFLGLLSMLGSLSGDERFLSYAEICTLYDDDAAWALEPAELLARVLANRNADPALHASARTMLNIEPEFEIPRDNFGALFGKTFRQTGLFEYRSSGRSNSAIALAPQLDRVLQGRIRFILDHPQVGAADEPTTLRASDLPEEVSLQPSEPDTESVMAEDDLATLVDSAVEDFEAAGLTFSTELVTRFTAALIAKRFIILTGLSGSGKTRLAQAFALWLSSPWSTRPQTFIVGHAVKSERIDYLVTAVDGLSVEFSGENDTRVTLPIALIEEWVAAIEANGFTRATPARTIREAVTPVSRYSSQLSSFETHLKAASFAMIEGGSFVTPAKHYEVVSVGPDWTSREASIGYIDALNEGRFVRSTAILDLILRAIAAPEAPFFLILDEMNLSHVERYFSDFLSASESGEPMFIHGQEGSIDGVPPTLHWPTNLFIIGTVNVDETTYMFSPKVLDRSNTIEFRIGDRQMANYLSNTTSTSGLLTLSGGGARFATALVRAAVGAPPPLSDEAKVLGELGLLFEILQPHRAEFGFRTAKEMVRFFGAYASLRPTDASLAAALDAQIVQKLLPKLSGTRRRLEGLLCALAVYCTAARSWSDTDELENREEILNDTVRAGRLTDPELHPLSTTFSRPSVPFLPLSYDKIERMLRRLEADGFTSFAEA